MHRKQYSAAQMRSAAGFLLRSTPEELRDMNKAISAARAAIEARAHLPGGAEVVIAEALADHEIARMLELLEKKRKAPIFRGSREQKGMTREQIRATAQRKREAAEARRREREQERQRQREQRRRSTAAAKIQTDPRNLPGSILSPAKIRPTPGKTPQPQP